MVARGDEVSYRAFSGAVYDAVVTEVRKPDGIGAFVDLDIIVPASSSRVAVTAIRWGEHADDPVARAFPKGTVK